MQTGDFPDNTTTPLACISICPSPPPPPTNCQPIKKGSTFSPDLKVYPLLPTPTSRGNQIATWKGFQIQPATQTSSSLSDFRPQTEENKRSCQQHYAQHKNLGGNPKAYEQEWISKLTNSHDGIVYNKVDGLQQH